MIFNEDYWRTADRRAAQYVQVSPRYIGVTTHPARDQLQELKSKIFSGTSNVELGFFGRGKGSRAQGQITPEMFGKEEREAMRNMAKVNEVGLTTHASANVMGFAGLAEGGFKEEARESALHEVERAIDFAADTAEGGPVVVHTSEFPREVAGKYPEFELYPEEEKRAVAHLVDPVTGRVIESIRKNEPVATPLWRRNEQGEYVDEYDNKVDMEHRVPVVDENGAIQTEMKNWQDFEKEAEDWNKQFPENKRTTAQMIYRTTLDAREKQARHYGLEWGNHYRKMIDTRKELEELKDTYEKLEKIADPERRKIFEREVRDRYSAVIPPEKKISSEAIKDELKEIDRGIEFYKEGATGSMMEARHIKELKKRADPIEKYGVKQSADTIARAGITAFDRERSQGLKKPLFVAPENVFPESGYGAHPQELKNLILKSRDAMADKLFKERKIPKEQAEDIAKEHIKATFDIGHAYTWKKFFKRESGETAEQTEKRFRKWMNEQVDDLTKKGIIGHVHLSDNFGYYDEHLTPGEGSVPIKEFVKRMQLAGFKKPMIVELGAQPEGQEWRAMTGAWRTLNAPVYSINGMRSWTDIEQSYFGHTGAVTYVVGDYAPSKDWTLWSEVQLE